MLPSARPVPPDRLPIPVPAGLQPPLDRARLFPRELRGGWAVERRADRSCPAFPRASSSRHRPVRADDLHLVQVSHARNAQVQPGNQCKTLYLRGTYHQERGRRFRNPDLSGIEATSPHASNLFGRADDTNLVSNDRRHFGVCGAGHWSRRRAQADEQEILGISNSAVLLRRSSAVASQPWLAS
jgi:hypothetical protein